MYLLLVMFENADIPGFIGWSSSSPYLISFKLQIDANSSVFVFFNPASNIAGIGDCPNDNIQFSGDLETE